MATTAASACYRAPSLRLLREIGGTRRYHTSGIDCEADEGIVFIPVEFEYDRRKSLCNKKKHGIDFEEAQKLWDDVDLVEIAARTEDESRYLVVGRIGNRHWSAVITYRGDATRIISVRRSRDSEIAIYEGT